MWRLFQNQFFFYWHIIRIRLLFWLIFMNLAIIILTFQIAGNPHTSVINLFFDGTSYAMVETHHVILPVLWFVYFFAPLLISLNSFKQLWQARTMHLRGLQIPPRQFANVNLLLLGFITTTYCASTMTSMLLASIATSRAAHSTTPVTFSELLCLTWLGVFTLLLIQAIVNRLNPPLALVIPAAILIATAYSANRHNPFGFLMLSRLPATGTWNAILIWLGIAIVMTLSYIIVDRNIKLA
ncbi:MULTISPECIES: LPXTG cell wall anchor domain-containing protein [Lacticaseibacillus]|uniref:LPXTG cell wall anchor domain-containing protein n=2 Tax=Lacticaseibacillus TaxID=2759736 RepID=A0ABZ0BZR5_LACCA|nr:MULTISPECIES: LPXTG cell wall anchor domain-containing protein [Lacticaseibacillus]KAB1969540.1 LPXTG cell wall anchor domain-containing protein [Lacticaseibacillus casei]WLV80519.1 LPXTG cell wall anchor domain-containing protein [Lacticaseibacillus sp. NCIMB 15473]WNX24480.1 LPXTG cell wall anchor domain-containing protein [Lacticaseibacillus casei]WNX27252.1 LPXTG cell wall anchor domain-containing protein [Lacticaseibacillus casei]